MNNSNMFEFQKEEEKTYITTIHLPKETGEKLDTLCKHFKGTKTRVLKQIIEYVYMQHRKKIERIKEHDELDKEVKEYNNKVDEELALEYDDMERRKAAQEQKEVN